MKWFLKEQKHLLLVFSLFLLLQLALFSPRLNSDGAYYFEFLRSWVLQNDLNFDDERAFYTWEWVPVIRDFLPGGWKDTGYPPNIFSFGPALVWLPFYLLSHFIVLLVNALGGHLSVNGYDMTYRFLPMMTAPFAGIIILYLIDRLGKISGFRPVDRGTALILMLGASHFPAFIFVTPAFSHAVSICAVTAFLMAWFISRDSAWNITGYALYGMIGGSMILARWQNLFCLVLPLLDAITGLILAPRKIDFIRRFRRWIAFAAGCLVMVAPQLMVTWILYGTCVTDPQGTGGMHWLHPNFRIVLFDGIKGLFVVNPILLIATIGLPFVFRKNGRLAWGMIVVFVVQLYINSVRRDWAGVGFGMRRFLNMTPVFALGLMALFDMIRDRSGRLIRVGIWFVGSLLIVWNVLLMSQYYFSRLGAPWVSMHTSEMISAQFSRSPELFVTFCRTGLIGMGISGRLTCLIWGIVAAVLSLGLILLWSRIFQTLQALIADHSGWLAMGVCVMSLAVLIWLGVTISRSQIYYVVDLVSDSSRGQLRKLTVNHHSGYQGIPGGILFGPGNKWSMLDARAQYNQEEFLSLGKLSFASGVPGDVAGRWSLDIQKQMPFVSLTVISRILPHDLGTGDDVATIRVIDRSDTVVAFPIRAGRETGCSLELLPDNGDVVIREYPAVNRVMRPNPYDTRVTFQFSEPIFVKKLEIEMENRMCQWVVHGLAFQ